MNLYEFATQPSPMITDCWQGPEVTTEEQFDMLNCFEVNSERIQYDSDLFRTYCLFVWWATQP
jgi:hypothetical protein